MLKDAYGFKHVYLAAGRTDLRKGQDSLLMIIKNEFKLDPFESGNIFMFCGTRSHVIKALVFEELSADFCYPHISYPDSR